MKVVTFFMFMRKVMELNVENAKEVLKEYLGESNPKKYAHSLRVADIAGKLAEKWRVNSEEAVIAALLHDIGKSMKREDMLSFCEEHKIKITDFEREDNQEALHGKISAYLFKLEFMDGQDGKRTSKRMLRKIAHAIESHVAGSEKMSLLDKIVFLADNIESKKDGVKILNSIFNDRNRRPGRYIGRIIDRKIKDAVKNTRVPNPGLLSAIPSGPEGDSRREKFAKALNATSDAPKGNESSETVTLIMPTRIVVER